MKTNRKFAQLNDFNHPFGGQNSQVRQQTGRTTIGFQFKQGKR